MDLSDIDKQIQLKDLEKHIVCVLCGGYLIDATSVNECFHSFCKVCIVRYLETSLYCPVCDHLLHDTHPLLALRPDRLLQDLVYKLVPGLLMRELRQRSLFAAQTRKSVPFSKTHDPVRTELISVALLFTPDGRPLSASERMKSKLAETRRTRSTKSSTTKKADTGCRYLMCPAETTIGHLKKMMRLKLGIEDKWKVDMFQPGYDVSDHFTLFDAAYFSSWKGTSPLSIYYSVYDTVSISAGGPTKRVHYELPQDESTCPVSSESSSPSASLSLRIDRHNTGFYIRHQTDSNSNDKDAVSETNLDLEPDHGISTAPILSNNTAITPTPKRKRGRPAKTSTKKKARLQSDTVQKRKTSINANLACVPNTGGSQEISGKRKRGRPRKYTTAGSEQPTKELTQTRCNFTFQNVFSKRNIQAKRLSIPVSLPKDLLNAIEMDEKVIPVNSAEQEFVKDSDQILASSWNPLATKQRSRCYPRTSTPVEEILDKDSRSSCDIGSDLDKNAKSSTSAEDSGYEASFVPKAFSVLRFNSDDSY